MQEDLSKYQVSTNLHLSYKATKKTLVASDHEKPEPNHHEDKKFFFLVGHVEERLWWPIQSPNKGGKKTAKG